jgi:hypothetical protein
VNTAASKAPSVRTSTMAAPSPAQSRCHPATRCICSSPPTPTRPRGGNRLPGQGAKKLSRGHYRFKGRAGVR